MTFYRAHYSTDGGNSAGFEWFLSWREAEKSAANWRKENPTEQSGVQSFDVECTKNGVLTLLQLVASHADNG